MTDAEFRRALRLAAWDAHATADRRARPGNTEVTISATNPSTGHQLTVHAYWSGEEDPWSTSTEAPTLIPMM
jgi:hypothetical protein